MKNWIKLFAVFIIVMASLMLTGWSQYAKRQSDTVTALTHGTVADGATTGYGTAFKLPRAIFAAAVVLDCDTQGTDSVDKLDVYLQTKLDGSAWVDAYHFTQIDGNAGAAKYYVGKIETATSVTEFETGAALAEATGRDLFGDEWRVKYVVTDADGDSTWSFGVYVCPM
jgi:hypothetical protein